MIEAEAIPYEAAPLRGERLLVLAPHPDDEVIGCGGVVAQHLRERRPVLVVVATDGAQGGEAAAREEESRRALAVLGDAAVEFLRFPDRALGDEAADRIREQLLAFRPDLILVPSPIEIHPDHFALSRLFCELVQRDETLFADLAVARVAFYEVGQPLRPNAIVDISDVAETKYTAIAQHASQLAVRDYVGYARGLNAYRAMTLPAETKFAEAYYVVDLPSLRTTAFSELRRDAGAAREIESVRESVPISVVIRTKDRPALLREAIDSVRATRYPCEIVVVNDGGAAPDVNGVKVVTHEQSRGRSMAANAGVSAASSAFIVFLDDDDLFYPEHLTTLANASRSSHIAWYTDAVSATMRRGQSGGYETQSRLREYAQDFDRDLLLVDNYIPLTTILLPRETFLDLGGFDPAFDLFEDWDFLIRLSQRGDFLRVPRVTCEVRHFEGGSSVVLASPEGTKRFRDAKLQVWRKHAELLTNDALANAFERQKRRVSETYASVVETKGQVDGALREAARLEREKQMLIAQNAETANTINGYALRVRELEGALGALRTLSEDLEAKTLQVERLGNELESIRIAHKQTHEELTRARVEIERVHGLLDMIYHSRTWKIHTLVEKLRGRG